MNTKIFIVEFTSAGGFTSNVEEIESILIEGLAMLDTIIRDALSGGFDVHAIVMDGLKSHDTIMNLDVNWNFLKRDEDLIEKCKKIASRVDYSFLIAPEFHDYLFTYTKVLESLPAVLLSQPSLQVEMGCDKESCMKKLKERGISTPPTIKLDEFSGRSPIKYPVVVKPNKGAGCAGVFLVEGDDQLNEIIQVEGTLGFNRADLIVQSYIEGTSLSASAIGRGNTQLFLGINEQDVSLSLSESKYNGGMVGPTHPYLEKECRRIAGIISETLDLRGFFGLDFILDKNHCIHVVEVNPRLTTSFVGLKVVNDFSLTETLASLKQDKSSKASINLNEEKFACYKILNLEKREQMKDLISGLARHAGLEKFLMFQRSDGSIDLFLLCTGTSKASASKNLKGIIKKLDQALV
ncbi:MAG: ATP-grasp domain-containing protein [Candidatus Hodarchaeota archaeon]